MAPARGAQCYGKYPSRGRRDLSRLAAPPRPRSARGSALSRQVGEQRGAHGVRDGGDGVPVMVVVDAQREARAGAQARNHGRRQLETQKVHGGSLLVVLALEVLVRDREDSLAAAHLHPAAVLDALEPGELAAPLLLIRKFEQQRHLPVVAVGNERVVGAQLLLNALRLEDALATQHLLDLILHGETVLEGPGGMRADRKLPRAFVLEHLRPKCRALARVALQRQQLVGG